VQLKLVRGFEFAIVRRKPHFIVFGGGARQWGWRDDGALNTFWINDKTRHEFSFLLSHSSTQSFSDLHRNTACPNPPIHTNVPLHLHRLPALRARRRPPHPAMSQPAPRAATPRAASGARPTGHVPAASVSGSRRSEG